MNRKTFLTSSIALGTLSFTNISCKRQNEINNSSDEIPFLHIPNFCSHEHWGSIFAIGNAKGGFRNDVVAGATPSREFTLMDILIDPYMTGNMENGVGINPWIVPFNNKEINIFELAISDLQEAFKIIRPYFNDLQLTGTYQCLRQGIIFAYNFDISDTNDNDKLISVSKEIGKNYNKIFNWYQNLSKTAHFTNLIRPVHPEYYFQSESEKTKKEEFSFSRNILRIDSLISLWGVKNERRDKLAEFVGVEPNDAKTWRLFIEKLFDISAQNGNTGIKQLQAYNRDLDFQEVDDSAVSFRKDLSDKEKKTFGNWVVNECCKQANERNWPHQIHVGTDNLPYSNPLPLKELAQRYPKQKLVLLHCWPFIEEAGYLAKKSPNIYLDTCWEVVLNPKFLDSALENWLSYVPLSKITMSNDSTSIEMAVGSSIITKQILYKHLTEREKLLPGNINQIAANLLHNNAINIYSIGDKYLE